MATDTQIKVRTATALARVMDAAGRLADRFPAVEAPDIPTRIRYPELLPLMQMEALAGFLDAVDGAMDGPKATPPPDADESPADGAQDAPEEGVREMTRAELNTVAARIGIESPEKFANKADLIAAIDAAHDALPKADAPDDPGEPV